MNLVSIKMIDRNRNIWIPNKVLIEMKAQALKWKPLETGGVLMGYTALDGDLVVSDLIGPGKNAKHKKHSFEPDQKYQLLEIENIYLSSNKSITYLGDWHSHPHSKPELSSRDKKTLENIAIEQESQNNVPVMVILGSVPNEWTIKTVQFISSQKTHWWSFTSYNIDELTLIPYD